MKRNATTRHAAQGGFTLVEVLVALGIKLAFTEMH